MEFVRSQRSAPEHDPNTRHVIYGLVSLTMVGSRSIGAGTDFVSY